MDGARLALVAATGAYTDPGLDALRAPGRDAADMAAVLADPAVGGFAVTDVVDRPEAELRRALDDFLAGARSADLVLVYLSCHGVLDARGRLYYAAADTAKDRLASTALSAAWLNERLDDCSARRQVLVLDCCFSGSFAGAKAGADLTGVLAGGRGRVVLTASRAREFSFEGEPLEGALSRSLFTAALVDGLRSGEADHDGDGVVSVEDAFRHAAARVDGQTPQLWAYGREGDIVLARNPRSARVLPASVPESLQSALHSPYPAVRVAAVGQLGEWLNSADPRERLAAQTALTDIAANDIPSVGSIARGLLPEPVAPEPVAPEVEETSPKWTDLGPVVGIEKRQTGIDIARFAASVDGSRIVLVDEAGVVWCYEDSDFAPARVAQCRRAGGNAVSVHPASAQFALLDDGRVRFLDFRGEEQEAPAVAHPLTALMYGDAFGAAPVLYMGAEGGQVTRWPQRTWSLSSTPLVRLSAAVTAFGTGSAGDFAAGSRDGWVYLSSEAHQGAKALADRPLTALAVSTQRKVAVAGDTDGVLHVVSTRTGERVGRSAPEDPSPVVGLGFVPRTPLVVVARGGAVHAHDLDSGEEHLVGRLPSRAVGLAVTAGGAVLAASRDGVRRWRLT